MPWDPEFSNSRAQLQRRFCCCRCSSSDRAGEGCSKSRQSETAGRAQPSPGLALPGPGPGPGPGGSGTAGPRPLGCGGRRRARAGPDLGGNFCAGSQLLCAAPPHARAPAALGPAWARLLKEPRRSRAATERPRGPCAQVTGPWCLFVSLSLSLALLLPPADTELWGTVTGPEGCPRRIETGSHKAHSRNPQETVKLRP